MRKPSNSAHHVQQYRDRMRRSGLRLVQVWVSDARAPGFAEECLRQSQLAAAATRHGAETLDWLDHVRDVDDWTA